MDKEIVIGKIVAPHGVRGDIRIMPLTEKPERFLDMEKLLLDDGKILTVKYARFQKHMILVTTKEITSMNEAELYRDKKIILRPEDLPELEEGQYYVADLIGLPVYDEQGKEIGKFRDAFETGSNDVYAIATKEGKDLLIPALERYVKEINVKEKRIVVIVPEYIEDEQ